MAKETSTRTEAEEKVFQQGEEFGFARAKAEFESKMKEEVEKAAKDIEAKLKTEFEKQAGESAAEAAKTWLQRNKTRLQIIGAFAVGAGAAAGGVYVKNRMQGRHQVNVGDTTVAWDTNTGGSQPSTQPQGTTDGGGRSRAR